jgi:hypothetical protein
MNLATVSTDFAHFPGNVKGAEPLARYAKTWVVYLYFLCEKIPRPKRGYSQIVNASAVIESLVIPDPMVPSDDGQTATERRSSRD